MGDHWKSWLNKVRQMKFQVLLWLVPSTMSVAIQQHLPSKYYQGYPPLAPRPVFHNPYLHPSVYPLKPYLNNPYPSISQPTTSNLSPPHHFTHHPYFSNPTLHHPSFPSQSLHNPYFPLPFIPSYLPPLSSDDGGYVHDPTGDVSLPYMHSNLGDSAVPYLHDNEGDGGKSGEAALPYEHDDQGDYQEEEEDIETTTLGSE